MSEQPVSIHQIQAQFGTDSANYEVLTDAAIRSKGVEGAAVEVGVRLGGGLNLSSTVLLRVIKLLQNRSLVSIRTVTSNTIAMRSLRKGVATITMKCATSA